MTKEGDFKLLKIQTCALKVNLHCDGCKQKVKKLLQRTEGVYQVIIDADQQKVTVLGNIGSATLIKKLIKAGKYAEYWSQKSCQSQKVKDNSNCIKHDNNNGKGPKQGSIKGVQPLIKHQQKYPEFSREEDDDDEYSDEDEDEDDYDDELGYLGPSQLGLLRQQAISANNAKKIIGPINGNTMTNNLPNGNALKNGNPHQSTGIKVNPGVGIDPKVMAALNLNSAHLGRGNTGAGESRRGNDISTMMNLAGFNRNGSDIASSVAALGSRPNSLEGVQVLSSNKGYQGSSAGGGFPNGGNPTGQYASSVPTNFDGYNHPASTMMNIQNRHVMQQQPQMMYHRSPFVPPTTGYHCYNSSPSAYPPYSEQNNYNVDHYYTATTHMFSDENTSSCSVM